MTICAEYIWIDGTQPVPLLRSKTRILDDSVSEITLPKWGFDGSSTCQAPGDDSDRFLNPVRVIKNPLSTTGRDLLVLCEVMNPDNTPHESNMRSELRNTLDAGAHNFESWWGFEQEYVFMKNDVPLGWPTNGYPEMQGDYYCGVGKNVVGREIVDQHLAACLDAGLLVYGVNAEVMLGQWEFQVGYRGLKNDSIANPLLVSDHLWLARWLLNRIAENHNVGITLHPKPVLGDWNGSGCHTNFSTNATRAEGGVQEINRVILLLSERHMAHQNVYGHDNRSRLTGLHETCHYDDFKSGTSDRGASIRIPVHVMLAGKGYIEDRRPAANIDPYQVTNVILKTICEL